MSAPLRFLGLAIVAYVGLRTASSALALEPVTPLPIPQPGGVVPQALAEAEPLAAEAPAAQEMAGAAGDGYGSGYGYGYASGPGGPAPGVYGAVPAAQMMPQAAFAYPFVPAMMMAPPRQPRQARLRFVPAYYPAPYSSPYPGAYPAPPPPPPPAADNLQSSAITSTSYGGGESPPLDAWPAIGTAGPFSVGGLQETPSWGRKRRGDGPVAAAGQSRWSADIWALARPPRSGLLSPDDPDDGLNPGLASAGALGGSQAGLRISWQPRPRVGVHLRTSTALIPRGRNSHSMAGGEGSVGISYQPVGALPLRLLAERRQRLGPALGGGRNAFAFLAEGGISDRELAHGIRLDGYGQAGVVGARSRDWFADRALSATYPFMPRFAVGGGVWGGAQPGLSRFDAGPRLSYQLNPRLRMHLDYRFRVTGRADPPSGPALTIAGGF
jgi:hypothetical protein